MSKFYPFASGNCEYSKYDSALQCAITDRIDIYCVVWNPDSTDWCATQEGFYRSRDYLQPPEWRLDGELQKVNIENEFHTYVLDTLKHTLTATSQGFPTQTFTFKAVNNRYNFPVCSKNVRIFESDSIRMTIKTMDSAIISDDSPIPLVYHSSSNDSNAAILTFNSSENPEIKITSAFMRIPWDPFFFTPVTLFYPQINSCLIWVSMLEQFELSKKRNISQTDSVIIDTIGIVFSKGSIQDTMELRFQRIPNPPVVGTIGTKQNDNAFHQKPAVSNVFDLNGRLVSRNKSNSSIINHKPLTSGVYINQLKSNGHKQSKAGLMCK